MLHSLGDHQSVRASGFIFATSKNTLQKNLNVFVSFRNKKGPYLSAYLFLMVTYLVGVEINLFNLPIKLINSF